MILFFICTDLSQSRSMPFRLSQDSIDFTRSFNLFISRAFVKDFCLVDGDRLNGEVFCLPCESLKLMMALMLSNFLTIFSFCLANSKLRVCWRCQNFCRFCLTISNLSKLSPSSGCGLFLMMLSNFRRWWSQWLRCWYSTARGATRMSSLRIVMMGYRYNKYRMELEQKGKSSDPKGSKEAKQGDKPKNQQVEAIKVAPKKVRTWFMQLSFWKKIIIIFTLNTLVLLILTDAIMLVLFGKISDDIVAISNQEKDQFNQVANTQIAGATAKMTLSKLDLYGSLLNQLANTYYYFSANPQMYTSLETADPPLPKLTSSYVNSTYSQPGVYYLNSASSFTPLSYLDELLGKMIQTPSDRQNIKRINVFVVDAAKNDLSARTVPASNQFTIPSLTEITNRFEGISQGNYTLSAPYNDTLTTSSSPDSLIALRTALKTPANSPSIFLEIQLVRNSVLASLQNIYYFPSASIVITQKVDSSYIYYTPTPDPGIARLVSQFYPIGKGRITVNGDDYVTASVGFGNQYTLGRYSSVSNSSNDALRVILLARASDTQRPAIQIQSFLSNQSYILNGIVFCWSFIILLSTVALATVVGNYIFSNLKMLSTKMQEYIRDPSKFHLIVIQLKELQLKGILKKLSDNLIGIIEKIQVRKRERKDRINQNYHPLSIGEPKFQERQQLNDYQIIEEIKEQVRLKVEALKKEAEEKEKAEKQKAEKERVEKERTQREKEREGRSADALQLQKKNQ